MKRHDYIRDALCQALERIPGVRATREPRVENPQGGGDQRRGDIRVHKDGTTWVVDVGVVCPGTARYVGEGAATVPGTAAAVYEGAKFDKYSDQPNFVPFIVETGGRVGGAGRRFLDTLVGRLAGEEAAEPAPNGAGGEPLHGRTQPSWPGRVSVRPCGPLRGRWSGSRATCWHRSRASSMRWTARWRGWWVSSAMTGLAVGLLLLFFLWVMI